VLVAVDVGPSLVGTIGGGLVIGKDCGAAGRCFHFDLDQKRGFVGRSGGWRYMGPTPPSKGAARKSGLFGRPSYTNEKPVSFEENWLSWTLR